MRIYTIITGIIASLLCSPFIAYSMNKLTFSGSSLPVLEETPDKSTGINNIYIIYDVSDLSITYDAASDANVTWFKYGALGGGYAEEIKNVAKSGRQYTLQTVEPDMGYIIEEGSDRYYFWITNYIDHRLWLKSIRAADEQNCNSTNLIIEKEGTPIYYYTINGRRMTLSQDIELSYNTQEWDEEAMQYRTTPMVKTYDEITSEIHVSPPAYADTRFVISGDKFLKQWNWLQQAESDMIPAYAVDSHTVAEQAALSDDPDFVSNIIGGDDGSLGGSAPADITFYAYTTDAAIHHEWQFAHDMDFEDIEYRFNEQTVNYIFREQGTMYVRYVGSNASGECESFGETYTIHIGDSELKCPNAFSPGASPGVNDEWKVSYRSIIDFECWIFNRHGEQIFHFTDPLQGWDGKHRGKLVKPGVYFYVIDAKGADGKHYKLSGDINILNYRNASSSSNNPTE